MLLNTFHVIAIIFFRQCPILKTSSSSPVRTNTIISSALLKSAIYLPALQHTEALYLSNVKSHQMSLPSVIILCDNKNNSKMKWLLL